MTHLPHVHMIVPGGGLITGGAPGGACWISSRPAFPLPVRVLGALFRRLFLTQLLQLHQAGRLAFFGSSVHLTERRAFLRHLAPVRKKRWVVYAKPPFAGPQAVLAYLSRYTHRVAISNRRLIAFDERGVTFGYKDYRRDGPERQRVMTLATDEFIRRFLLHVLPRGFHRIRHYGLLASSARKASLTLGAVAMAARHVGRGPGLVDEDEALGFEVDLLLEPASPAAQDVGPVLFDRVAGLFLRVILRRSKNRHSVPIPTGEPRSAMAACISASVISPRSATRPRMKSAWASVLEDR